MAKTYTTRQDAINYEIVEVLLNGDVADAYESYDIDAIAEKVIGDYEDGFSCTVDESEFWAIVEEHSK